MTCCTTNNSSSSSTSSLSPFSSPFTPSAADRFPFKLELERYTKCYNCDSDIYIFPRPIDDIGADDGRCNACKHAAECPNECFGVGYRWPDYGKGPNRSYRWSYYPCYLCDQYKVKQWNLVRWDVAVENNIATRLPLLRHHLSIDLANLVLQYAPIGYNSSFELTPKLKQMYVKRIREERMSHWRRRITRKRT